MSQVDTEEKTLSEDEAYQSDVTSEDTRLVPVT